MQRELAIQLIIIFIITQLLGVFTASTLIKEDIHATIVTENPDDVENAIGLFAYILVFTSMLLIAITFFKGYGLLMRIVEVLAVFGSSFIVFYAFFPEISFLLALCLIALRKVLYESLIVRNIACMFAVAGVGALLGASIGLLPVIVFMSLLAVYDLIAVFGTKHMIKMANAMSEENMAFAFAFPTKEHTYQLGTGDIVIPLTFAVTVMNATAKKGILFPNYFLPAILILFASLIGLLLTLEIAARKKIALPALPLQVVLMIIVWIIAISARF